ncbi:Ladinin-1 [Oryzias melastigma]|uniref:Ladinin-1 n=1 Tax=Oryzias melastigma TaxID=30732 RepID=A0A834C4F6_ORYME|nr:Ladinin-1 [Oryzias melastigma]
MSISRKNWSALSSLARQWTMEDEEEAERERRRRGKSITTAEPDVDSSPEPKNQSSASDSVPGTESSQGSQDISSVQQMQLDFVEMLRVRDEKRRMRHVEILRQQKEEEDDPEGSGRGGDEGGVSLALLGGLDEEKDSVFNPQPPVKTSTSSKTKTTTESRQHENGKVSHRPPDPDVIPASSSSRKFVSSVSISLDNSSPSASGQTTPTHPSSPMGRSSPQEHWSPSTRESRSPVQNGHTVETSPHDSSSKGDSEQTAKAPFVRQSSRTLSFRMMKKKEEEKSPLQRSSSVRIVSKKFESSKEPDDNEDKASFQRNSRQRISSRSIKEKMERLAQAAQKSEASRSPDVTQRTLFLLEEVSRKRTLFEKDEPAQSLTSPGASRNDFKSFTSGMSERINRFKSNQSGSSLSPDLRHVDISSKRSLFENRGEDAAPKTSPGKTYK